MTKSTGSLTTEQAKVCMGEGLNDCCIYVAIGPAGFTCIRNTTPGAIMLNRVLEGDTNATWIPAEDCRFPEIGAVEEYTGEEDTDADTGRQHSTQSTAGSSQES